jgi:hypothetical protein
LAVDNADGSPGEQRVAESRRHARRQIDLDPVPLEEINQRRQPPVAAKARAVIFRLARREAVDRPAARPSCDLAVRAGGEIRRGDADLYRPDIGDGCSKPPRSSSRRN